MSRTSAVLSGVPHARQRPARAPAFVVPAFIALTALMSPLIAGAAADCSVTVNGVAFGAYDPLATAADDSTGTVTVTCTNTGGGNTTVNYTVALSAGTSGAYAQRLLRSGTPRLSYNLYSNSARTTIWGNGSGGTSLIAGTLTVGPGVGNGTRSATHTIYGRVPAQQDVVPGNYADTIVVTLTF